METKVINDGGPAFPLSGDGPNVPYFNQGMSLRAYFAGQAMQGMLANPDKDYGISALAEESVEHADALIAALAKRGA